MRTVADGTEEQGWLRVADGRTIAAVAVAATVLASGFVLPFIAVVGLAAAALVLLMLPLASSHALNAPVPVLGVMLAVAVSVPVEVSVGGPTLSLAVLLSTIICIIGFIRWVMPPRPLRLEGTLAALSVVSLMGVALLSFLVGQFPWFPTAPAPMPAQLGGLAIFLLSGGLFLVVAHEIRSVRQLERLTWIFVASGAFAVFVVFIPDPRFARLVSEESIGSGFWTWLVAICVGQALCNRDASPGARLLLLTLALLALGRGLFLAFSWVSGWLPPLIAMGTICLLRFPRMTVGLGLTAIGPLLLVGEPLMASLESGESYSLMTRGQALEVMSTVVERNPLLGFGPANYYYYTLLFPILGWYVSFSSHNQYVDLIAQTGIVGLVVFGVFAAAMGSVAFGLFRRAGSGFAPGYLAGAIGGLTGSLVSGLLGDWLIPFYYNIGLRGFRSSLLFWVFLGGVLALGRFLRQPKHVAAYL